MLAGRRAWIASVTGAGAALALGAGILVTMRHEPPPAYTAGEKVEGISSDLDRLLPADRPAISFRDAALERGIRFVHLGRPRTHRLPEDMGPGAAWGDIDGDGDDDLFLPNFSDRADEGPTHALYRNRGDGRFDDVTVTSGLSLRGAALGAGFADVENDGDQDLLVTQFGRSKLFRNRGDGTFEDASAASGLDDHEGFWTGVSWADHDGDGDLDAYICGYVVFDVAPGDEAKSSTQYQSVIPFTLNPSSFEPERNLLLQNDGRGRFTDVAAAAGVACRHGRSLSATWADWDEDGDPDLYVANDVSDNALYLNRGDGTFEDASHAAWVADHRGAMGLGLGDPDGDLDLDVFVTHWIAQENALYRNMLRDLRAKGDPAAPLRFIDVADREGLGQVSLPLVGWGTDFVDFDGDGRVDLFAANGSTFEDAADTTRLVPMKDALYWNAGAGRGFFDIAPACGEAFAAPHVGRGAAFADVDLDGDVDILVSRHGAAPGLLVNEGGNARAWLGIRLSGNSSNRFGVGARIEVEVAGRRQVRVVGGGSSYLSQSSLEAMFGLGDAAVVDLVEILWPSGHVDVLRAIPSRTRIVVEEGGAWKQADAARATSSGDAGPVPALTGQAGLSDAAQLDRETKQAFWSRYQAAQAARGRGDHEAAISGYREALEILPRHDDSLYWLGNSYLALERWDDALLAYTRLVEANPVSARGHQQVGVLHSMPVAGAPLDLERAEIAFRRALEINREESGPMTRLGEVLLVRGRRDEAHALLEAAARLNPRAVSALYACAHIEHEAGREPEALAHLARAAKALEEERPVVKGATAEGDTQERLRELHRAALRKSLLAPCWEDLRSRVDPAAPASEDLEAEARCIGDLMARLGTASR